MVSWGSGWSGTQLGLPTPYLWLPMRHGTLLLLAIATPWTLRAQTTWNVPGHFTDLPAAVAAAVDGDTILVGAATSAGPSRRTRP